MSYEAQPWVGWYNATEPGVDQGLQHQQEYAMPVQETTGTYDALSAPTIAQQAHMYAYYEVCNCRSWFIADPNLLSSGRTRAQRCGRARR